MTWSIVAHDPATGAFAVAVTTCAFAVGASCPFVRSGVGAVSTQSMTNRYLGPAVLDGMARGLSPTAAIESALAGDEGRGIRQIHAVDRHGRSAAWTGRNCVEWCGDRAGQGFSVAGNMLAGEAVLADTVACFVTRDDLPLAERLVAALEAGDAAALEAALARNVWAGEPPEGAPPRLARHALDIDAALASQPFGELAAGRAVLGAAT